jgi:hypothetical protein
MESTGRTMASESVRDGTMLELPKVPPGGIYEDLCVLLYAYRFGTIGFLDLVARYEEALGIKPPHTDCQKSLGKEE